MEEEESEEEEEVRLCSPPAYVSPRPDCALVSVFGAPLWRLTPRIFALARLLHLWYVRGVPGSFRASAGSFRRTRVLTPVRDFNCAVSP